MFSWPCSCKEQIVSTFRFWTNTRNVCHSLCRYQTLSLWKFSKGCTIMSSIWRNEAARRLPLDVASREARTMTCLRYWSCQAFRSQALFAYLHELEPYCVVMSPPCIAMRCLKQLQDTWQAAMDVGCLSQHKPQLHWSQMTHDTLPLWEPVAITSVEAVARR